MSRGEGERANLVDKIKYFENSNSRRYFKVIWNISSVGNPDNLIISYAELSLAIGFCESETVPKKANL